MTPHDRPPPTHTILEYLYPPERTGHRCGYCKSPSSNFSHGLWAHRISAENYESLINVGWRRSGSYVYKPMNEKICCPMYTIRNLSTSVQVTRSQRKVLKRFRAYVIEGRRHADKHGSNQIDVRVDGIVECSREPLATQLHESDSVTNLPSVPDKQPRSDQTSTPTCTKNTCTPKKPHPLKKKPARRERKRQKLLAKGLDPDEFFSRNARSRVRELTSYFDFADVPDAKHKFTTKLVQVDGPEFETTFEMEHALYTKYQMSVHGDTEHDCRASQFRRFLCDNPFSDSTTSGMSGTYHQHYYMDSTLIAVGVLDLLPSCVSSVYFFYDPDWSHLSPGTLGALHEISLVNTLHATDPKVQYYYLGFYIHSCVKMKYKSKFRPAQLVCPVNLEWVDFDARVCDLLEFVNGGFTQLADEGAKEPVCDLESVLLLHNRKIYDFSTYAHSSSEREELESYVTLVTPHVASNALLFRSSAPR